MTPIPDRAAIETDWNARGFGCDLWVDPSGQRWEDFVHDVDEVVAGSKATSSSRSPARSCDQASARRS